jgi:hypothetical protein
MGTAFNDSSDLSDKKPGKGRGGSKPGRKLPPRKDGFAGGTITPQQANEARWGKDRRTVVEMARQARPEAFATVRALMLDAKVEPSTRLRAGELILAYSDGKPRQSVDIAIGGPRPVSGISTVELEAMLVTGHVPFALEYKGEVIDGELVQPIGDKYVWPVNRGVRKGKA